jgi:hypothetical protein
MIKENKKPGNMSKKQDTIFFNDQANLQRNQVELPEIKK